MLCQGRTEENRLQLVRTVAPGTFSVSLASTDVRAVSPLVSGGILDLELKALRLHSTSRVKEDNEPLKMAKSK